MRMPRFHPYLRALLVGTAAVGMGVSACGQSGSRDEETTRQHNVDLVSLEAANTPGSSPWTDSITAADPPQTVNRVDTPNASRTVSGDQIGLYGGSTNRVVCDRDKLIQFLETNPAKAAAWRSVTRSGDLRSYVLGLSPVFLTHDTRLTNYGFKDGAANPSQAVLQTGTAVLVDNRGLPCVRCDSGSPLDEPRGNLTTDDFAGQRWNNLDANSVVAVQPSKEAVTDLKLIPVAPNGVWAPPATTAPREDTVLSVDIGDDTAVVDDNISLPGGTTVHTVDVTSNRVTTTNITTATTTVQTTTTTAEVTTTTESSPPTTDIVTEPSDTGTPGQPTVDDPGTVATEPNP
jgi:hypothetical protein